MDNIDILEFDSSNESISNFQKEDSK
jgi:hypothetical protein